VLAASPVGAPHSAQNLASSLSALPQLAQAAASRAPHCPQNLAPGSFSDPQELQFTP
jgi:hypothetical protein